jgi:hypothetical protein
MLINKHQLALALAGILALNIVYALFELQKTYAISTCDISSSTDLRLLENPYYKRN